MLLRIQRDESLSSFVARNLFLNWSSSEKTALAHLTETAIRIKEVREIATAMGWLGCFGFNRLLHNHTHYPRYSIFKIKLDPSYSNFGYQGSSDYLESSRVSATFCPDCVKEDLADFGFSYWRRVPDPEIKVCVKHNVRLVNTCPFCKKPFSFRGHGLDVMWRGCKGQHLGDTPSVVIEDSFELKKAQFIWGAFSADIVISAEAALLAVSERLRLFGAQRIKVAEKFEELSCGVSRDLKVAARWSTDCFMFDFGHDFSLVWESILLLYDEFDQFLEDVKIFEVEPRPASSLWSTYCTGVFPAAHFVEENYAHGVAHWFCVLPLPFPPQSYAAGGHYRQVIYPCCNFFPLPLPKWPQRKPRQIGCAQPGVPILNRQSSLQRDFSQKES